MQVAPAYTFNGSVVRRRAQTAFERLGSVRLAALASDAAAKRIEQAPQYLKRAVDVVVETRDDTVRLSPLSLHAALVPRGAAHLEDNQDRRGRVRDGHALLLNPDPLSPMRCAN